MSLILKWQSWIRVEHIAQIQLTTLVPPSIGPDLASVHTLFLVSAVVLPSHFTIPTGICLLEAILFTVKLQILHKGFRYTFYSINLRLRQGVV